MVVCVLVVEFWERRSRKNKSKEENQLKHKGREC
jgi:hypothetical protein